MTQPMDPQQFAMQQQLKAARAAAVRSLTAIILTVLGTVAATVGAGATWGSGPATLVLGGCVFILGVLVAVVG